MNINVNRNTETIGEKLKAIEEWLRANHDVISDAGHSLVYSHVTNSETVCETEQLNDDEDYTLITIATPSEYLSHIITIASDHYTESPIPDVANYILFLSDGIRKGISYMEEFEDEEEETELSALLDDDGNFKEEFLRSLHDIVEDDDEDLV